MVSDEHFSSSLQSGLSTRCYGTGEFMYVILNSPQEPRGSRYCYLILEVWNLRFKQVKKLAQDYTASK